MTTRPLTKAVAVLLVGVTWLAALGLAATVSAEAYLRWQAHREVVRDHTVSPRSTAEADQCREADTWYVHPHYLYFFPFTAAGRTAISNDACGITPDGFRKPGPDARGDRRLAFLVGGSVAFSQSTSSDATTITSALNRLQDEYFFVTAGVSGWNSAQELSRLAFQLLDYQPALIVTLDGANDARIAEGLAHRGGDWIGAPANFDVISDLVSRQQPLAALAGLRDALFPSLALRWRMHLRAVELRARGPLKSHDMELAASRYVTHLVRMHDLTTASGGRFVAIFQPMVQLHHKQDVPIRDLDGLETFHAAALRDMPAHLEFHDFGRLFDRLLPVVRIEEGDVTDETVFVDPVHLHDRGNAMLAQALWEALAGGRAEARPAGSR